jgi:ribulose-5-phosphate 4-epimerase/fuculose-1-phosphate aldolase
VTNLEFRPVFGAYDPSALQIVLKGVPVFPRSVSIVNKQLAADLLACMGDRDVVLMKGHGITVTGKSLEEATSQAIRFDRLARVMWELATSGRQADEISPEDVARYDRRGRAERPRTPGASPRHRSRRGGWDTPARPVRSIHGLQLAVQRRPQCLFQKP